MKAILFFFFYPSPFQGVANRLKCASEDAEKRQCCVLLQHRDGFERSQLNLDRLNLTHTYAQLRMRSQLPSLGFQQTSSGWNDESLVRCICFLRVTGDRRVGVEGWGLLLICPMRCQHLTNFVPLFKRLPALAHLYFLLTPLWARLQRTGQCKWATALQGNSRLQIKCI